jgi:hypothetical protein
MTSKEITKFRPFREHVARALLDSQNSAQCGKHLENRPSEYDVDADSMAAAIARAKQLGLVYDLQKPWRCWAIAMLKETTQSSALVMRGMLQLEFLGSLAVATLSQNTLMKFDTVQVTKARAR